MVILLKKVGRYKKHFLSYIKLDKKFIKFGKTEIKKYTFDYIKNQFQNLM